MSDYGASWRTREHLYAHIRRELFTAGFDPADFHLPTIRQLGFTWDQHDERFHPAPSRSFLDASGYAVLTETARRSLTVLQIHSRIEDLEFLLSCRTPLIDLLARLGFKSAAALLAWLRGIHRFDLEATIRDLHRWAFGGRPTALPMRRAAVIA